MPQLQSLNFQFLRKTHPTLERIGAVAEQMFASDPVTCLMKLRQFGERLAQTIAARVGLYDDADDNHLRLLNRLDHESILPQDAIDLFHQLRIHGNRATHQHQGDHRTALANLKYARQLAIAFQRAYNGQPKFKAGAFIPPPDPVDPSAATRAELDRLKAELQNHQAALAQYQAQAAAEAELRAIAEQLLTETEAEAAAIQAQLQAAQHQASQTPSHELKTLVKRAKQYATIDLDESATRQLIDEQLRAVGWTVDTETLTYGQGARPAVGTNCAIAEWPVKGGTADYGLFIGLDVVGVVEAKRRRKNISERGLEQSDRYSRHYRIKDGEQLLGRWDDYRIPFIFAANGRPYLEQLKTESGIWFRDLRRPTNLSKPLMGWPSPDDLRQRLAQDVDNAHAQLEQDDFSTYGLQLRDYQKTAIRAVETALSADQARILLAMATGTGKTKTAIALVYRLLKTRRFRRLLFLVDRTTLSEQSHDAFKETKLENLQTFADIFEVRESGAANLDPDTKVQIATVQSFVKRLFDPSDDAPPLSVGFFDCIVVDECHRGYLLDQDLSEDELQFRSFEEYVSKYRRVLDYFDAVQIGLTATPALHTTQIFGEPVYRYSYRTAVIDGHLIDHEPPIQIRTRLAEDGIIWEQDEDIECFDPQTGELDLITAPDEVKFEVQQFNQRVITESFNRAVCQELTQHLDLSLPAKTLVFCASDRHADLVVTLLREVFSAIDPDVHHHDILKITGNTDDPKALVRRYKNEASPKIAVTVDLLTTGIDVPKICNLVFLRRVNSRILYEQMVGRATRPCDEIGKTVFQIYDAVRLYEGLEAVSTMKPVIQNPSITFEQLFEEISRVDAPDLQQVIVDQFLAKLHRKHRRLSAAAAEQLESAIAMPLADWAQHLKTQPLAVTVEELRENGAIATSGLAQLLDRRDGGAQPIFISHHADEVIAVETGYGRGRKPQDYLDEFTSFLREHHNEIPALVTVMQRPQALTRADLKALKLALDGAGFTETALQTAWRETTNQDIAASIIGFIRQAALGDALIPYGQRVDRALQKVLSSQAWQTKQRQWLERIAKQLKQETIVDRDAFNQGEFRSQGGWSRIDKVFNGNLAVVVTAIHDALWEEAG
ncbi:type I restriction-modification system endonuclease [Spirulina major CS-329]|uniref:type I restriction-modification system endonuclease n=1 Tax=Spirulina TaxID=1154 RepID=UPI00232ABEAB|nr:MULTISPECIES: type I restriction-modification system endonuclease [Spirulina]MDB9494664.1 type I restriction-modification system endonuclease [Spirulina subsalsa CS-330]MDB9503677.1 type I restriction-modification system endonuclease [Spirulina major CS-329]